MATPLDYETPQKPNQPTGIAFWISFLICGLSSSCQTDEFVHWLAGKHTDGGTSFILMALLLPSAFVVLVLRHLLRPSLKLSATLGAASGLLAPPLCLGVILLFDLF